MNQHAIGWDQEEHKPRRRKDRAHWCRGKPGVEHIPGITKPSGWRAKTCAPRPGWSMAIKFHDSRGDWWCWHRVTCTRCGKVLVAQDRFPADRCPDRPACRPGATEPGLPWALAQGRKPRSS